MRPWKNASAVHDDLLTEMVISWKLETSGGENFAKVFGWSNLAAIE